MVYSEPSALEDQFHQALFYFYISVYKLDCLREFMSFEVKLYIAIHSQDEISTGENYKIKSIQQIYQ